MRPLFGLVLLMIITITATSVSAGCAGSLPANHRKAVGSNRVDYATFSATVRYYVNVERCRRSLSPLVADPNLLKAAIAHSQFMAKANNMTHTSSVRGQRTLRDRMHTFSVNQRVAAENIAQNFVFSLVGRSISISMRGPCQFTYADNGQPVPQHSYASLAQHQVANWMASSKHHANLMNRRFTRMETAYGFAPDQATCGRVYLAQDFAG